MTAHRPPWLANLLVCCLTILASGDDFSLYRIGLPSCFPEPSSGTLPLDDPNTDFLQPAKANGLKKSDGSGPGGPARPATIMGALNPLPPFRTCYLAGTYIPSPVPAKPLRC
jgi:hypothetical protein